MSEVTDAEESSSPQDAPEGSSPQPEAESAPLSDGAQRRISDLVYQRNEAQNDVAERDKKIVELENQLSSREVEQITPKPEDAPNPMDFDDNAAFEKASREFTTRVAEDVADKREAKRQSERKAEEFQDRKTAYRGKIQQHAAKDKEYGTAIANANLQMTETMAEVLFDSPKAVELTGYLANHPEEAVKLSRMTPLETAREMGRIEAGLESLDPKTVSDAPAPMKEVGGTGEELADPEPSDEDSPEDWLKKRRAQKKRQRAAL